MVKAVLQTTEEMGQLKDYEPHKQLSNSVGTHNLTELRARLEQQMLIKTNEKNRTTTAQHEDWQTYRSTPLNSDDVTANS